MQVRSSVFEGQTSYEVRAKRGQYEQWGDKINFFLFSSSNLVHVVLVVVVCYEFQSIYGTIRKPRCLISKKALYVCLRNDVKNIRQYCYSQTYAAMPTYTCLYSRIL